MSDCSPIPPEAQATFAFVDSSLNRPKPRYREGDRVLRASSPDDHGQIIATPEWDCGDWWYRVRFDRTTSQVIEQDLIPEPQAEERVEDLASRGQWGTFQALRRAIAVEKILRQNKSTVYAFNSQRIRFMPHQYKPLLKILSFEERRLLVADEVGLGKTIEAGLILTEFRARQPTERVLVLCPSRLRQKWRDEMLRKFNLEFDIWGTREILEHANNVMRATRRISFQAIVSMQTMRRPEALRALLDASPGLDCLIVDEAHHARNSETSTSAMVAQLSEASDSVVFLTATPLHLGQGDLFQLLKLLRPEEFNDEQAFINAVRRNEGVVAAQKAVRRRQRDLLPTVARQIEALAATSEVSASDPLLDEVLRRLSEDLPSNNDQWIDLEWLLEQTHVLSHTYTRTKKREAYEHSPERKGAWVPVKWTQEEALAYDQLSESVSRPDRASADFGLGRIQRARQAASSIHGTLLFKKPHLLAANPAELSDFEHEAEDPSMLSHETPRIVLPPKDSKLERLMQLLKEIWSQGESRKVIIFTYFTGTGRYLEDRLKEAGVGCVRIAGDVPSKPRQPERDERGRAIEHFRTDPDTRVLVSTEVGSEGLDFQFCSFLVNYDLPWNPMVVEQRIGRIDRYGQTAPVLHFYSLVVENSIEDRILRRLYDRIEIFERTLGDLESVVGEHLEQLRSDYFLGRLSPEELEQKVDEAARVIARQAREAKELEAQASELFGHGDHIREEVSKVKSLGRYVTHSQILSVLTGFLSKMHPDTHLQELGEDQFRIRITNRLIQDVQAASDPGEQWALEMRMRAEGDYLRLTTDGESAYDDERLGLLNASHPLVRTAAKSLEVLLSGPAARTGSCLLRLSNLTDLAPSVFAQYPVGQYFLGVYVIRIGNDERHRFLECFAVQQGMDKIQIGDEAERFLHLCLEHGEEHPHREGLFKLDDRHRKMLLSAARQRTRERTTRERNEKLAMYSRRRQRLEDEYRRKLEAAERRLQTVRSDGRGDRIINLNLSQIDAIERNYRNRREQLEADKQAEVVLADQPTALFVCEVIA